MQLQEDTAASDLGYTREEEDILRESADRAQCYRILHTWDYDDFNKQSMLFTIPVIVLSTLTGTANFAQSSFPPEVQPYTPFLIGAVNITAGIITTVSQFLRINELQEGHRVAAIAWGKYSRNLKYELSRHPKDRTPISEMMKMAKAEFDRLMETSPAITKRSLDRFTALYSDSEVSKPEICDGLQRTSVFRACEPPRQTPADTVVEMVPATRVAPPASFNRVEDG